MIVDVKKAKVFILEENKVDLLLALQRSEVLMLTDQSKKIEADVKYEDDIIQRATTIVNKLSDYHAKPSFLYYHTVLYDEFVKEDVKRIDLLEHIENDFKKLEELKAENERLTKTIYEISPFKNLPYTTNDLGKSLYVTFHLGYVAEDSYENLLAYFNENHIEHEFYELSDYGYPVIFVLDKDSEELELEKIKSYNYKEAKLPLTHLKINKKIEKLNNELNNNIKLIKELEAKFTNGFEISEELKVLIDQTAAKKARMLVDFKKTDHTVYVEGWVREDEIDKLHYVVNSVTKDYDIDISERAHDEIAPTATKNNKFVSQFETITNMFSVPNTDEVDPNPVMSIWYWIIFGIMMGDIGYGLLMVIGLGLFIKFKKPKGEFSKLVHVLYYSGYTSIIAGIIFGSIFGADIGVIEFVGNIFNQNWKSFSMMDNILTMLIISIAIGVLHLASGLFLKVKLALKHNDPLTALADGVSWISILLGGSVSVIGMTLIQSNLLFYTGLAFVGIGFLLIILLAGRDKKGAFGKVTSGLGGIYGTLDYVSDLLSYSRILALALSSSVIAFTMNTLAGLVQGSFIGVIFSIIIYIVGHLFNFAMGLLSAYVHDSRLQYIEFFGKFYEGGGYEFKPLSFETKYINEITN